MPLASNTPCRASSQLMTSQRKPSLIYDTIRDAILTYNPKPTWVRLIYSMEPTTKTSFEDIQRWRFTKIIADCGYMHDNQSHLMKTLTSFADPLEIRLGLPINDLLLAKFDEVSPVFDPFSLFGEFSTAAISIIPSLPLLLVTRITAEHKNKQVSACRLHVGRTSTVASIVNLATVQFVTLSFHFRRTKLTTRCDNQRAVEKFSKLRVCD